MLQIYGVPISVHTRKVIVAAIEKNLPYQLNQVVPVMPDSLPADWRDISPTGLIPVVTDGDFTLADSGAICGYLEQMHPQPPLYPPGARAYGRAIWFEQYAGSTVFRNIVHPLFREVFVNPKVNHVLSDPTRVDAVLDTAVPEVFGYLESRCGASRFLAGERMTMGDVAVVSNLVTFQYLGFTLDAGRYPKLSALFELVILQPSMLKALRAEQATVAAMGLNGACVQQALA